MWCNQEVECLRERWAKHISAYILYTIFTQLQPVRLSRSIFYLQAYFAPEKLQFSKLSAKLEWYEKPKGASWKQLQVVEKYF